MRAVVTALLLSGCAVLVPNYYERLPTAEICRQLLTLPSYNVNQGARMAEIDRRNASCGSPSDVAGAQRDANRQVADQINSSAILLQQPPPPQQTICRKIGQQVVCTQQ